MTRLEIATVAMQGLCASATSWPRKETGPTIYPTALKDVVETAFDIAEAMIAENDRREEMP